MLKYLRHFFIDGSNLFYAPNCDKSVKRFALLFAIFALLGASIGIPFSRDNAYYLMLIVCVGFLVYKGGIKISTPFLVFYLIIIINVLIVDIPPIFKPMQRSILFILLTIVSTSVMETEIAIRFRAYLFKYLIFGIIVISVGSFFCFFLGINLMISNNIAAAYGGYATHGGWFSGLASHSMILGPISMISALTFYFLYQAKSRNIYLIFFFLSAMSTVFSASRSSLLAIAIAIIYNLIAGHVNAAIRKKMIRILAITAILTIPISGVAFKGIINKQESREKQHSGLNSRQGKFDCRIAEFKSSPLFGVGFCAIDINGNDEFDPNEGRIEPGTSHLSVLSMLGIIGFIAYIAILYNGYKNTKSIHTLHSRFVFSCFLAFFVHAWFEGYILAGGGFLALIFWLILGQCIDCPKAYLMVNRRAQKEYRYIDHKPHTAQS